MDVYESVKLPPGMLYEEWLSKNVIRFFNQIYSIYENIAESCTESSCPIMSGGSKVEYHWADEIQVKPLPLPAYKVRTYVCTYVRMYGG